MGQSTSPGQLPSLLIIDDDPISREVMSVMLEMLGFPVLPAESGERALTLLQSSQPEVILMDAQMPGLSGAALIRTLRTLTPARIFAVSGSQVPDAILHLTDGFLLKPVQPEALAALLNSTDLAPLNPETISEPVPAESIDPATLSKLKSMMSPKALRQLYAAVAADLAPRLKALQSAMDANDAAEVSRIGHAIKGGCSMVGLTQAADAAALLEASNSSEAWAPQLAKLHSALQALECILILDFPV